MPAPSACGRMWLLLLITAVVAPIGVLLQLYQPWPSENGIGSDGQSGRPADQIALIEQLSHIQGEVTRWLSDEGVRSAGQSRKAVDQSTFIDQLSHIQGEVAALLSKVGGGTPVNQNTNSHDQMAMHFVGAGVSAIPPSAHPTLSPAVETAGGQHASVGPELERVDATSTIRREETHGLLRRSSHAEHRPIDISSFHKRGFVYVQSVFPKDVIDSFASKIDSYVKNRGKMAQQFAGGAVIPDFRKDPYLADIFEAVHTNEKVHAAMRQIFGGRMGHGKGQYRFLSHNDIGMNVKSAWHKDRLSGIYRGYESHSPWDVVDGEEMRVVKVGMYLQDHSNPWDHTALRVVTGSHNVSQIPGEKFNIRFLHPSKGDVIIFDQRITHGGQGQRSQQDHVAADEMNTTGPGEMLGMSGRRIMMQLGYGWNNRHSDDFETGTVMRQRLFQSDECGHNGYSPCARRVVQADFKKRGIRYECDNAAVCP
mmetsp:Transcript_9885/g.20990  ORF Transcript_9885/g.20990 Transcript_9885/m.20990 type:complete len:480 (-) Transcript_9885:25-1464(-)|eukprot:CAMPEP_0180555608 /NCGR_PEP_ID=MMETSP1037_2-20121125/69_1 /TAXON_ID=632150 /ORGANISM="Azadinium spinosum, Strain 3D9" /LENGTH=479 /DNA_ID=CAMNT_0022571455 /DNA_START=49 /DNA_END=1488 /DNA_ORIENTATION=-